MQNGNGNLTSSKGEVYIRYPGNYIGVEHGDGIYNGKVKKDLFIPRDNGPFETLSIGVHREGFRLPYIGIKFSNRQREDGLYATAFRMHTEDGERIAIVGDVPCVPMGIILRRGQLFADLSKSSLKYPCDAIMSVMLHELVTNPDFSHLVDSEETEYYNLEDFSRDFLEPRTRSLKAEGRREIARMLIIDAQVNEIREMLAGMERVKA